VLALEISQAILIYTAVKQQWECAEDADSDEAAQAFRDDGAWYSDMMSPRARSLAGW
jgi:hypothetical protein